MTTAAPGGHGGEDPICIDLRREIIELIHRDKHANGGGGTHGIKHRIADQINGANGPGTGSWDRHDQAIRNQQQGVRNRLEDWDENNCGPPPKDAWHWATRPPPKPSEWVGPGKSAMEMARDGALLGAAAYATYRAVRLLPSLFPPAWWTLPANLAIP